MDSMNNNSSLYRKVFLSSLTVLLYLNVSKAELKPVIPVESKNVIIQQDSIASKVKTVYEKAMLGKRSLSDQGHVYEIDNKEYNVNAGENDSFLAIFNKDKQDKYGFLDKNADGVPDIYINPISPLTLINISSMIYEAFELYNSQENKKSTNDAIYDRITNTNSKEILEKFYLLLDKCSKH